MVSLNLRNIIYSIVGTHDLKRVKISTITGMKLPESLLKRVNLPLDDESRDDVPYPGPSFELPIKQVIKKFGEPDMEKQPISQEKEYESST